MTTLTGIKPEALPHEKKALFVVELRRLANSLSMSFKERFTEEVLDRLGASLLDGTVFDILQELRDIQKMTENELATNRKSIIAEQNSIRNDILSKNNPVMSSTTFYGHSAASYGAAISNMQQSPNENPEITRFNAKCEDELRKTDMRIVLELDGLVSQQQLTLEKAGIPGFFVTNKPDEIRMQLCIVDFIEKLRDKI